MSAEHTPKDFLCDGLACTDAVYEERMKIVAKSMKVPMCDLSRNMQLMLFACVAEASKIPLRQKSESPDEGFMSLPAYAVYGELRDVERMLGQLLLSVPVAQMVGNLTLLECEVLLIELQRAVTSMFGMFMNGMMRMQSGLSGIATSPDVNVQLPAAPQYTLLCGYKEIDSMIRGDPALRMKIKEFDTATSRNADHPNGGHDSLGALPAVLPTAENVVLKELDQNTAHVPRPVTLTNEYDNDPITALEDIVTDEDDDCAQSSGSTPPPSVDEDNVNPLERQYTCVHMDE